MTHASATVHSLPGGIVNIIYIMRTCIFGVLWGYGLFDDVCAAPALPPSPQHMSGSILANPAMRIQESLNLEYGTALVIFRGLCHTTISFKRN